MNAVAAKPYTTADAIRHADMLVSLNTAKRASLAGRRDDMCDAIRDFMDLCDPDELHQFAVMVAAAVEREAGR